MEQQQIDHRLNTGDRYLQALRAEEEPWLEQVYVKPAAMDDYTGSQSMIFFGGPGSGRTALRLAIIREVERSASKKILVVNWLPEAPVEKVEGNLLARFAMRQLISVWVETILQTLTSDPECLRAAPQFLREGLAFFIREYLPVDPIFYLLSRSHELPADGVAAMMELLRLESSAPLLRKDATTQTTVNTLNMVISQFGFGSTWVYVDGLEKWHSGLQEQNRDMLAAMLDTLNYYDRKDIVFKVFVPSQYSNLYNSLGGVNRFRLEPKNIIWNEQNLMEILNRRAGLITGQSDFTFEQVTSDKKLLTWLRDHAGGVPRWWVLLGRYFVNGYMEINKDKTRWKKLDEEAWRQITLDYPPPLRIDQAAQQVMLGERVISVSPSGYNILLYLYRHPNRVCTREEIYYLAVSGKNEIPANTSKIYEESTTWASRLDTSLWRLRKEIEPNPGQPVYLITMRDKGICLQNFW